MIRLITRIAHHPYLNLLSGLVLLITASHEILISLEEGIGTHHGIAIFGAVQIIKSLPELMHGAEGLARYGEVRPIRHSRKRQ